MRKVVNDYGLWLALFDCSYTLPAGFTSDHCAFSKLFILLGPIVLVTVILVTITLVVGTVILVSTMLVISVLGICVRGPGNAVKLDIDTLDLPLSWSIVMHETEQSETSDRNIALVVADGAELPMPNDLRSAVVASSERCKSLNLVWFPIYICEYFES